MTHLIAKSARLRSTPYTKRIEEYGVQSYTVYNHMLLPASFKGIEEDSRHLKNNVQLWDVSGERQVQIQGPDAAKLTQLITCRDLSEAKDYLCYYAPIIDNKGKIIKNVGHIRVFAAFASIASITILFHWIYVHPYFWFFLRLLTGFSLAAIYIVCESWLNDRADNKTRGKLIGLYMVILYFSTSGGGLLINLKETTEAHLYILTSLLISFALVPILLTKKSAPEFSTPKFISLKDLYKNSPMSFIGSFGIGMIYGASFGLIAVFGAKLGLSIFQISILVFVNTFIGALFQYPIGKLSDTFDRRIILLILNIIALASSILLIICSVAVCIPIAEVVRGTIIVGVFSS